MLIRKLLNRAEQFFLSRQVAVVLFVLTLAPLFVAVRIEDASLITASPFFLILPAFIFLSVLLCTLNRLKGRRGKKPHRNAFTIKRNITLGSHGSGKALAGYFIRNGWVRPPVMEREGKGHEAGGEAGEGAMVFMKGGEGFWGSVVFHAGLLVMFIATGVTAATLFNAEILLNEGVPTPLGREGLLRVFREPALPVKLPAGSITLEGFEATFENERFPVDYTAHLKIEDDDGVQRSECRVNSPLNLKGIQYTINRYGFSPGFRVEDESGKLLFDGFVTLIITDRKEDFFRVPDTDLIIEVVFFPDFYLKNGQPASRSNQPENPAFGIKVKNIIEKDAGRGKIVKMGESARIRDIVITPTELKYWAHFGISRDAGFPLLFLSFVLMSLGLTVRFIRYEKWLVVTDENGTGAIELSAYSRYFPALFEAEVERIAANLLAVDGKQ